MTIKNWVDYMDKALSKRCYSPAHEITYPLISLQTELNELNNALRKLADRVKNPFPPYDPGSPRAEPLLAHAREELGDVLWAYTALTQSLNWVSDSSSATSRELQDFWNAPLEILEEKAVLSTTVAPCKLKTAVPTIYSHLSPIADFVCKRLRSVNVRNSFVPDNMVNEKLLLIGQALVRITKALGTGLERTMHYQLDKMNDRESEGKFVTLTSTPHQVTL